MVVVVARPFLFFFSTLSLAQNTRDETHAKFQGLTKKNNVYIFLKKIQ
jgi:hypothetical protein